MHIDDKSLEPLVKQGNRPWFEIRHVKIKIYKTGCPVYDMNEASNLVTNMSVEGSEASNDDMLKDDRREPGNL